MAWGTTRGSKKIFIKTIAREFYPNLYIICKGFPQPGTLATLPPGVQYSPMKTWRYLSSWMTWSITTRMDMHTTSQLRWPSHSLLTSLIGWRISQMAWRQKGLSLTFLMRKLFFHSLQLLDFIKMKKIFLPLIDQKRSSLEQPTLSPSGNKDCS